MKKLLAVFLVMVAGALVAAPAAAPAGDKAAAKSSGLVAARSQISKIVQNPKLMTKVMKSLSASEQLQFIGEVNRAIDKLSGSNEEKVALLLNVNRAALNGAAKGNLGAVVAEIFATVPVQSLTVINESFAQDAFNRAADPKVTYTDKQYIKIAKGLMQVINARLATADNAGLRGGFAALMLIRASNNESPEIQSAIIATLPATAQEVAKQEWFPAALASGDAQSYEPMLGMAEGEAGSLAEGSIGNVSRPVKESILRIAGVQETEALLADLSGGNTDPLLAPAEAQPVTDAVYTPIRNDLPQTTVGDGTTDAAAQASEIEQKIEYEEQQKKSEPEPEPEPEPGPYAEMRTK